MELMMNTVLTAVTSALLLTSSMSFAGTMGPDDTRMIRKGFYVAGDIGVAGLVDKESHNVVPETHQLGALGIIGGGYLGYEYGISDYSGLALEFFADATGHIILGYTNGKFTVSDNGVYGYINTGYNKSGFQTGLGFTTLLRAPLSQAGCDL